VHLLFSTYKEFVPNSIIDKMKKFNSDSSKYSQDFLLNLINRYGLTSSLLPDIYVDLYSYSEIIKYNSPFRYTYIFKDDKRFDKFMSYKNN
jgi:hypothetical protein